MAKKTVKEELEAQSDDRLIADAKALHESINVAECFGKKDLLLFELVCRELEGRGYEIREVKRLVIARKIKT